MEWGKQMEKHQENAKLSLYQNTNYTFERREKKTLILDYKITSTDITKITLPLYEPLIIDKLSDVYLESFTTFNAVQNSDIEKSSFVISIDEFNINTNSNKYSNGTTVTNTFNKIIIPNEVNSSNLGQTFVHKAKKLNYICSINPTKLRTITIQITDLAKATMFSGTGRFILEMVIVARDDDKLNK